MDASIKVDEYAVFSSEQFDVLLGALQQKGYQVIGPTVRNQTIVYDTLSSTSDLPIGYAMSRMEVPIASKNETTELSLAMLLVRIHANSFFIHLSYVCGVLYAQKRALPPFPMNSRYPDMISCSTHGVRAYIERE